MSRSIIEDRVLRISVGLKAELQLINEADVREIVSQLAAAADLRAPADIGIAGFLGVEDVPQDWRGQFLVALGSLAAARSS